MAKFVEGRCMALIATDVAARGIDVEGINCVIHYDPAENGKVYKHRSGRTARAGAQGTVISLVQNPQKKMCSNLQKEVGIFVKFKPPEFNDLPKYEVEYIPPPRQKSKPRKPRDAKRARFHGNPAVVKTIEEPSVAQSTGGRRRGASIRATSNIKIERPMK